MDSTRRGFLGLLAHLPLVGAWLGRPKESEVHKQIDDVFVLANKMLDQGIRMIRWIPVTERLPEECGFVLVAKFEAPDAVVGGRHWPWMVDHAVASGRKEDPFPFACGKVSYWAEMPEPPAQIFAQGDA